MTADQAIAEMVKLENIRRPLISKRMDIEERLDELTGKIRFIDAQIESRRQSFRKAIKETGLRQVSERENLSTSSF